MTVSRIAEIGPTANKVGMKNHLSTVWVTVECSGEEIPPSSSLEVHRGAGEFNIVISTQSWEGNAGLSLTDDPVSLETNASK